ncbi:hypothetical protein lerEdw1_010222 [Lerista edwardsae]|nr:hypothetical protein lerEdw1_010222 [Lerista edwardsae]
MVALGPNLESDYAHEMRLVNSSSNCSGRVEVFHNGQWGTICDDRWGIQEATVVCRHMGCGEARAGMNGAYFGRGAGPIWLDFVACTGNESALHQCHALRWGPNKCWSEGGAGVVCSGVNLESDDTFDIRLVNGPNNCSGRVEVYHNGLWGTVCDFRWSIQDATVVCQEMGCGEAISDVPGGHFGRGSGPI